MKQLFRKLFSPLLSGLEAGDEPYNYRKSSRTILLAVGGLFLLLATVVICAGVIFSQNGAAVPGLVFLAVSICCLAVGWLGSDRAVAKIWGNK